MIGFVILMFEILWEFEGFLMRIYMVFDRKLIDVFYLKFFEIHTVNSRYERFALKKFSLRRLFQSLERSNYGALTVFWKSFLKLEENMKI